MYYSQKNVLVTGGAGFIGSALVKALVDQGAYVTVLDDLSSGSYENIASLGSAIRFIQGSIGCKTTCLKSIENNATVFHCAAFVSVPYSYEQPQECYEINVQGTLNVLHAAQQRSARRFVFSSSCAVYGPHSTLLSEDTLCIPQSPYGLSKFIGELLCKQYTQIYGLQTVSLRYFNVISPGFLKGVGVASRFEQALRANKDLIIYGDGNQTRDFISLQSVIEANLKAGSVESIDNLVINVASGKSISINELLCSLRISYPFYQGTISYQPARMGDIQEIIADTTHYQKLLTSA